MAKIECRRMNREELRKRWNELKSEGMTCGYYWLDDVDHPELCENGDMPEFPCEDRSFIVESCWYKKDEKSVEIRQLGGDWQVTEIIWNASEDKKEWKKCSSKEYFVATQKNKKIYFSEISDKNGNIVRHAFTGFEKEEDHAN